MKYLLLSLLLFLPTLYIHAQSREAEEVPQLKEIPNYKESRLVFKLGAGMPQGDFGDDNPLNIEAGTAETGILFEMDFFQELNESFYFSLMARFQANGADPEAIASALALQPNISILEVTTDPWKTNSFMVGFGTIATSNARSSLLTRFMIGYSSIASPSIIATASNGTSIVTVNQESVNSGTLSFLVGLGLKININEQLSFLVGADYYAANPEFNNVTATGSTGGFASANFEQKVRIVNLSFGLGFNLN